MVFFVFFMFGIFIVFILLSFLFEKINCLLFIFKKFLVGFSIGAFTASLYVILR